LPTQLQLVKKLVLLFFYCVLAFQFSFAQTQGDTIVPPPQDTPVVAAPAVSPDTIVKKKPVVKKPVDSIRQAALADTTRIDSISPVQPAIAAIPLPKGNYNVLLAFQEALHKHPYYNFFGKPTILLMREKKAENRDGLFYLMVGIVFFFAIIRIFFAKYLDNISTLFFRVTMRQQQLRDQLSQAALPSLLLNALFVLTSGLYIAFLARYHNMLPHYSLWLLWAYGALIVLAVYTGKFIILKIVGWIFNVSNATDTYIFIIFMVNKMVGIFLIPVLVLMAFPFKPLLTAVVTLSYILLAASLGYRFLISYKPIRHEIKVSRFHFFLYLCAFELAPLLLIYRVLLIFVERS
jgi:hypothetical protein